MDNIIKYFYDENKKVLTDFGRLYLVALGFSLFLYGNKYISKLNKLES